MAMVTLAADDGGAVHDVVSASITIPRIGAWQASLWIDATEAVTGKVLLRAGALYLRGTVHRASAAAGIVRLRVVGGADGLRTLANPKHYVATTVRLVLAELCAHAGETLSPAASARALTTSLGAWTTAKVETGAMVQALCEIMPWASWRILDDGTLWIGEETWPDSGLEDYATVDENPEEGWVTLAMDVPRLLSGTTFGGLKADVVEHLVSPDEYRAKVWLAR